jgi:hypothetical protein
MARNRVPDAWAKLEGQPCLPKIDTPLNVNK